MIRYLFATMTIKYSKQTTRIIAAHFVYNAIRVFHMGAKPRISFFLICIWMHWWGIWIKFALVYRLLWTKGTCTEATHSSDKGTTSARCVTTWAASPVYSWLLDEHAAAGSCRFWITRRRICHLVRALHFMDKLMMLNLMSLIIQFWKNSN